MNILNIFYEYIEPLITDHAPEKESEDVFANFLCVLNRDTNNAHSGTKQKQEGIPVGCVPLTY